MAIYKDLKEAIDLAGNPDTPHNMLVELAKCNFTPVLKLIVQHPNTNSDLIRLCAPKALNLAQEFELLTVIAAQQKTPHDLLKTIGTILQQEKLSDLLYQLALEYYSRPDVSQAEIEDFVVGRSANAKFRNELWKKTDRPKIRKILDNIRKDNKDKNNSKIIVQEVQNKNIKQNEIVTIPASQRDLKLIGSWTWSDASLASYGLNASVSVHETYVFFNNGQFYRTTNSFASYQLSQINESITPDERGKWSSQAGLLTLDWDDGMVSEFSYFIASGTLELSSAKRQRYYLKN